MNTQTSSVRHDHIDALRGIAVICMILAHSLFFFHDGTVPWIRQSERFFNLITLTLFVFVSGLSASRGVTAYAHLTFRHSLMRTLRQAGGIFLAYAAVTISAALLARPEIPGTALTQKIVAALTFTRPFNFTEYMSLFILLPFLPLFGHRLLFGIKKSVILMCAVAFVSYAAGLLLYPVHTPPWMEPVKLLLAGGGTALRFPLLFYIPIYVFGIWWDSHETPHRIIYAMILSFFLYSVTTLIPVPIFSPDVRWPPSVGFIIMGITVAILLWSAIPLFTTHRLPKLLYKITVYFGRDALDFWLSHLILLFAYGYAIHARYDNPWIIAVLTVCTFVMTSLISSLGVTNAVSWASFGPVRLLPNEPRRIRKRYIAVLIISSVFVVLSVRGSENGTRFGSVLPRQQFGMYTAPVRIKTVSVSTARRWYSPAVGLYKTVTLSVRATGVNGNVIPIQPDRLALTVSGSTVLPDSIVQNDDETTFSIQSAKLQPGRHTVTVSATNGQEETTVSNTVEISVTQPLWVAWTFDWEGWDVDQGAMDQIRKLKSEFGNLPVSHFVNPRMFLPGVLPPGNRQAIIDFLNGSQSSGDEIALHLHMHYDLISASGVSPHNSPHWGLRSDEGYDVPGTVYSPEDYTTIASYGKKYLEDLGFTPVTGYRAGGWFISTEQLRKLRGAGFLYDSSGRDKPATGAFRNSPWNLEYNAQPYYPDESDQNKPSLNRSGILEIPNNGLTTYESTPDELIRHARLLFTGDTLGAPASLVYVSHPQFAQREFSKIPTVLTALSAMSMDEDAGPVVFTTTRGMYDIWK